MYETYEIKTITKIVEIDNNSESTLGKLKLYCSL